MATLQEYYQGLIGPTMLMKKAFYYFVLEIYDIIFVQRNPFKIFDINTVKNDGFARFWLVFSAEPEPTDPPNKAAVVGSAALIPPLIAKASGVVLDVGPGSGTQIPLFALNSNISKVYGAEPCENLHPELSRRVVRAQLPFEYKIITCGAEQNSLVPALAREGLLKPGQAHEVFDSIVCVRVLCSVPVMEETITGLYALLKPGGKLFVVEHVKNPWRSGEGSLIARVVQAVHMWLGWSFLIGDCCLDRETAAALIKAAKKDGGWADSDLKLSFGYTALPYISGMLTKKSKV